MASYAAIVSLMNILEQILHPSQHRILVDRKQIEFLREKVGFLLDFLEDYSQISSKEKDGLESQMIKLAYAAEDLIETHVLDQIIARSAGIAEKSSTHYFEDIQKLLEEMGLIEKKVLGVKEMMGGMKNQQATNSLSNPSSRLAPSGQNTMLGFDDKLIQIMDRLTGKEFNRQVITITGMGGIGKTTLARNVYDNPLIVQYFDLRAWVTVSQEYSVMEIILALLRDINQSKQYSFEINCQLGEQLYKSLFNRKYFIVMDDVWSIEAWNDIRAFFPNNCNGSRILITTRESNVAVQCDSCNGPFELDFLSKEKSWELFCEKVFPQGGCPSELEDIGKKIVQNCRGLPLAIVVIGGLLAKSNNRQAYWEHVAENINSIINSGNDEHCLKLLSLSYSHLPIHLKPCFLYMATFQEDRKISVSRLIKLWVAEGFLKPVGGKWLEDIAMDYLMDLVARNLILVHRRDISGRLKSCGIHDILRDLCTREAKKEDFLCVTDIHSPQIPPGMEGKHRRLCIRSSTREERDFPKVFNALRAASFFRSMLCKFNLNLPDLAPNLRLLRVLDTVEKYSLQQILQLVNLRFIACRSDWDWTNFPILLFWNLQTITIGQSLGNSNILPSEIWEMQQLRHLKFIHFVLPDPPCSHKGGQNSIILENLQSLCTVKDFKFTEDVIERVPNLKKLKIIYNKHLSNGMGMKSLVHLRKLESLWCWVLKKTSVENLGFPCSLKKLTLRGCKLPWKDMSTIGSLPNLEVLKLEEDAFKGSEWYSGEGEFVKLKYLKINHNDLVCWVAESHHFPCLEHIVLEFLQELEEIPAGFGELVSLKLIELQFCRHSAIISAKQILVEQENMGNEDLQVQVTTGYKDILNLASENFEVTAIYRD